jgi:hypothetical protein
MKSYKMEVRVHVFSPTEGEEKKIMRRKRTGEFRGLFNSTVLTTVVPST